MEYLFTRLLNLRELEFEKSARGWVPSALQELCRATNNNILIEKLKVFSYARYYRDGSVADIIKYFPKLKSISIALNIDEDSLLALSTHCPLLEELDIHIMPRVFTEQSAALCALALSCIYSIKTPSIFEDTNIDTIQYSMTIPYMTNLKLLFAVGMEDHVFIPLISNYCMKLEHVKIYRNSSTTPTQLLQLAQNCIYLTNIELYNHIFFNDDVIIGLLTRRMNIESLTIYSDTTVSNITDASILALSENCPQLEELELYMCTQITAAAVLQLIQQCKQLCILIIPETILSEDTVFEVPVEIESYSNDTTKYTLDRR